MNPQKVAELGLLIVSIEIPIFGTPTAAQVARIEREMSKNFAICSGSRVTVDTIFESDFEVA